MFTYKRYQLSEDSHHISLLLMSTAPTLDSGVQWQKGGCRIEWGSVKWIRFRANGEQVVLEKLWFLPLFQDAWHLPSCGNGGGCEICGSRLCGGGGWGWRMRVVVRKKKLMLGMACAWHITMLLMSVCWHNKMNLRGWRMRGVVRKKKLMLGMACAWPMSVCWHNKTPLLHIQTVLFVLNTFELCKTLKTVLSVVLFAKNTPQVFCVGIH